MCGDGGLDGHLPSSTEKRTAKELERIYREGVHDGFRRGVSAGIDMAKNELDGLIMLPSHNYIGLAEMILRKTDAAEMK